MLGGGGHNTCTKEEAGQPWLGGKAKGEHVGATLQLGTQGVRKLE